MSKIQGNNLSAFQMPRDAGQTKEKDRSKSADGASGKEQAQRSNTGDDLPGVGLGQSQQSFSQGGFNSQQQSAGVLDVVEERQRRLQEDGIGEKLLGGGGDVNQGRVLHRELQAGTPTSSLSSASRTQATSSLQHVEALENRSQVRQVPRASVALNRQVGASAEEASAVGQRKPGVLLDDDLPRVGLK